MAVPSLILCCLVVIIILVSQATSQPISVKYCDPNEDRGNYTTNSTYHTNLNTLLSNLTSNTEINYGFYNLSYGQNSNKVYAIGLCRGDIKADKCHSCLNNARVNLTQFCPNQKEAYGWYDDETCMLRYSDRSIFGLIEIEPPDYSWDGDNETGQFSKDVKNLLHSLTGRAASGDSRRKYATETAVGPYNQNIYGLAQCTPDLSGPYCSGCLNDSISRISACCNNREGARIIRPSCILRYQTNIPFYDPTDQVAPPHPPPSPSGKKSSTSQTVIAVTVSIAAVIVIIGFICIYLRVRKPKNFSEPQEDHDDDDEIQIVESLQFNFETIRDATDDFSDSNKLGQGGFGTVYRGMLSNGQEIAVKRLSMGSHQGDTEFKNEVLLVAKLQHRNLVRLLGFCLEGRERLLIYEYVTNKSLDYFIFDPTKRAQLVWESRYKIICGIARGILYLHEDSQLRIIHRDLKASNILLDEEMNPKISDFGMARLFDVDQTQGDTNRIVGTYGYMAPEYALHGQFSVKSDIYSFGVLVLEIVSGRKIRGIPDVDDMEDLISFAWRNWKAQTTAKIVDPTLAFGSDREIMRCIHIGLLCVQKSVALRPTMGAVVLVLNSYSVSLAVPSEPAYFEDSRSGVLPDKQSREHNSGATRSSESTNISVPESVDEASITEIYSR